MARYHMRVNKEERLAYIVVLILGPIKLQRGFEVTRERNFQLIKATTGFHWAPVYDLLVAKYD
jgi:hypothetical protein